MSSVSFLGAFCILLYGTEYDIGMGYRWKRGVVNLALISLVTFPVINIWDAQVYTGSLPPEVPLVQSVGDFTDGATYSSYKASRRYVTLFHAQNGRVYQIERRAIYSSDELVKKINSGEKFYVEGFVLRNGYGFFWPTLITTLDGRQLLSSQGQIAALKESRSPFGKLLLWEYASTLPLWGVSLVNAMKIKNRLSGSGRFAR